MGTTDTTKSRFELRIDTLTSLHWAGVVLAGVTGLIHLWLAVSFIPGSFGFAFLVAAFGFFAGITAVLVDYRQRLMYLLGIPFTLGQVVIWYAVNGLQLAPVDLIDKLTQLALIAVLIVLYRQSS